MSQNHPEKDKKIYQCDNMRFSRPTRKSVAPDLRKGSAPTLTKYVWRGCECTADSQCTVVSRVYAASNCEL